MTVTVEFSPEIEDDLFVQASGYGIVETKPDWATVSSETLRQLWHEGLSSGESLDPRPVFKRLREKYS